MIRIRDTIAGDDIRFHYAQSTQDLFEVKRFINDHRSLGMDTESTGINCYRPGWQMRTIQYGDAYDSYVVPARFRKFIGWSFEQDVNWLGHNGPHDIRSVDTHLGYETGVVCKGETYIPSHHADSRGLREGGIGHGLKDISCAVVDREAGKWEKALKEEFKKITVRVPGEYYKSGVRKGQPKFRKAKLSEGWSLIDPRNRVYLAYAAADPLLTYRVWDYYQPVVREFYELYQFDHAVQMVCDRLQRRAIRLDVRYTQRLSAAYTRKAEYAQGHAAVFGCENIQSGQQIATALVELGAKLSERTDTGQFKTDARVLRSLLDSPHSTPEVQDFVRSVLVAKQLLKRREAYAEAMLAEMDADGRVHPSINSLAARTTRMSVSKPALQQLPTKDHEDDLLWDTDEEERAVNE